MNEKYLSVVIPAYNESKRIGITLISLAEYFSKVSYDYEVIVINDGSKDNTAEVARSYSHLFDNLVVIDNKINRGKGYAVKCGMQRATGEYKLFMDADNSVNIDNLDRFLDVINNGDDKNKRANRKAQYGHDGVHAYDVVIGSIKVKGSKARENNGLHRRILSSTSKMPIRMLATPGIMDTQRGFKLFTKQAAERIFNKQTIERFGFDIELLVIAFKHKLKIKELPVVWDNPEGSTVTMSAYVKSLRELAGIILNKILGKYTPDEKKQNSIFYKIKDKIGPQKHKHMNFFEGEELAKKGKGFRYKDKEFVHHTNLHHTETAFHTVTYAQKIFIGVAIITLISLILINWHVTLIVIFSTATILYFADLLFNFFVIYRSFSSNGDIKVSPEEVASLKYEDLPVYTIFCPLYKEWRVVPQFAKAMSDLDYPVEKLQILFLLEENDVETIKKIRETALPPHFEIVIVPHSFPKTKPKAMNYGLRHVKGEYLVIYDAEDIPEGDQLKKALIAFKRAPKNTVCVQAKLNFYNLGQNLLTRMFTAEYSLWFDLVLPGLQSLHVPIPLGGTSNHFMVSSLHELSGWDAFNVTEDCDLGIRLAKRGYRTAIVESTTYEEANSRYMNWYKQRSRWIKGYIQSYLVHMRQIKSFMKIDKIREFLSFQLIVGGKVLSMFINPFMWVFTILYFAKRAQFGPFIESLFPGPILYIGVFSFVFGNFMYLYYYMIGAEKRGYDGLVKYVFLVPLYWLGMSVSAWKGIYEIVVKPHYWAKTIHGLHLTTDKKVTDDHPEIDNFDSNNSSGGDNDSSSSGAGDEENIVEELENPTEVEVFDVPEVTVPVSASVVSASPQDEHVSNESLKSNSFLVNILKKLYSGTALYVISSVVANFLNFLFNAYLSRKLTIADFGTLTVLNTFVYFLMIFISGISTTLTNRIAFIREKYNESEGIHFFRKVRKNGFYISILLSLIWIVISPVLARFLNITDLVLVSFFAPTFVFGILEGVNNGYLQGSLRFGAIATSSLIEVVAKFALAVIAVEVGLEQFVTLSLPISILISYLSSAVFATFIIKSKGVVKNSQFHKETYFPFGFYAASIFTNISTMAFLSVDVILVKHYLSADMAGRYSLLSLVGKMIFFFGSLLNTFIVAYVGSDEGKGKNTINRFYKILALNSLFIFIGAFTLGYFGDILVPILLGSKSLEILNFLPIYSVSIALFTLTTTVVTYHLAKREYAFSWVSLISAFFLGLFISIYHSSLVEIIDVVLWVNVVYLAIVFIMHLFYVNFQSVVNNVSDFLKLFASLPLEDSPMYAGKRILIFNWRDRKHSYAGGAEVYIEELAKRWVEKGYSVTLFCGNDGKSLDIENVDGITVIRRGGFYFVYIFAFLYYMLKLRGKYDVVVDCENGIPFFTPLYVKEPVYCLLHHVHQEVFLNYLNKFLGSFACALEKYAMPFVYKNKQFITVSDSSKADMVRVLGFKPEAIKVIHPGIDLEFLKPGKKTPFPMVAYVGRLKEYKSVDVLISAFANVLNVINDARLVIAGDGDDSKRLKKIVNDLGISKSVDFMGRVSDEEKRSILQSAWVFVNPSHMEGWGITTIEANACGTACLASNVPGLRDSVVDSKTGFLVEYGNVENFSIKLTELLSDKNKREYIENNAKVWASNFSWQTSSDIFLKMMENGGFAKFKIPKLKKPNVLNVLTGAFILIFKTKIASKRAELPNRLGEFVKVETIKKQDYVANMAIGVYEKAGKKYFVKRWVGRFKDLNYYFLLNEYRVNSVLGDKLINVGGRNVKFVKSITYFKSNDSFTAIFEYVEGLSVERVYDHEKAITINTSLKALDIVSNNLTPEELNVIGSRGYGFYITMIPFFITALMIHSPKYYVTWLKAFFKSIVIIAKGLDTKLVLTHRDLTPSNIMKSGDDVYILDCESMVMTIPGYDRAYLNIHPGMKNVMSLIDSNKNLNNIQFLENYIALHHILGSGEYLKFEHRFLNVLKEIHA